MLQTDIKLIQKLFSPDFSYFLSCDYKLKMVKEEYLRQVKISNRNNIDSIFELKIQLELICYLNIYNMES